MVSLEQAIAAPLATRHLADLGARVIKVERPGAGDFARGYDRTVMGLSSHFVWVNRSKESLTLNLKDPRGAAILRRLIDQADVFVQNLGPGVAESLGFGAGDLRRILPRLVTCSLSGYGSSGPYRNRKAYDLLVQCESGLLSITGGEQTPAKVGISIADIAGGMYALMGILTALLRREQSGEGANVEVSLFDSLAEWMSYPLYYTQYGGAQPRRAGADHATIAPYGPFRTADGELFIGIQNDREWRRFCTDILGQAGLEEDARFSSNPSRVANRVELRTAIEDTLQAISTKEAIRRLEKAEIAFALFNSVSDLATHPQLSQRHRWRQVDSPSGKLGMILPPVIMEGVEPVMEAIPSVGEHTRRILHELGFAEGEVEELAREGVV